MESGHAENQLSKLLSGPIKTSGNIDRGILDENK
jgi:hypothetical protein